MKSLAGEGRYEIGPEACETLQSLFYGGFADRQETLAAIREVFEEKKYLMDPHSAVGYSVLEKYRRETGDGTLALLASTASPFKFNRAVLEALGRDPAPPDEFSMLEEVSKLVGRPVPAKLAEIKSLPEAHAGVCQKDGMAKVLDRFLQ
jgi:threonine synthase